MKVAYVDHTQFDKKDVHFDASSKADNPKWSMVWFMIVLCILLYTYMIASSQTTYPGSGRGGSSSSKGPHTALSRGHIDQLLRGGSQGVPRPLLRYNLSTLSWVFPEVSHRLKIQINKWTAFI